MDDSPVAQKMLQTISRAIPGLDTTHIPPQITASDLGRVVGAFNAGQFIDALGFEFPDPESSASAAGSSSQTTTAWKGWFAFKGWNPSSSQISQEIATQIFGPDPAAAATANVQGRVGHGQQRPIFEFLLWKLSNIASKWDSRPQNEWTSEQDQSEYPYKLEDGSERIMQVYSSWAFCNGTVTSVDSEETTECLFVSLLLCVREGIVPIDSDSL